MYSPDPGTTSEESSTAAAFPSWVPPVAEPALSLEAVVLLPLVNAAVLEDLEAELAGPALAKRFAQDYADMWDQRYTRLAAAVERQDVAACLDAAISLKITSAMLGGERLSKLAELLENVVRQGDFGQGRLLMERVAVDGSQTVSELQSTYIAAGGQDLEHT
ncbi:Hpt domain-containing protein [Pseudarthrobacter sp. NPDC092439]|uniref:Hpt domain-containing protein n=1 Tax=unclassified Pseudarthrobacter TaxID=2647000 RepID=UPI003800C21B